MIKQLMPNEVQKVSVEFPMWKQPKSKDKQYNNVIKSSNNVQIKIISKKKLKNTYKAYLKGLVMMVMQYELNYKSRNMKIHKLLQLIQMGLDEHARIHFKRKDKYKNDRTRFITRLPFFCVSYKLKKIKKDSIHMIIVKIRPSRERNKIMKRKVLKTYEYVIDPSKPVL